MPMLDDGPGFRMALSIFLLRALRVSAVFFFLFSFSTL